MEVNLAHLTWTDAAQAAQEGRLVIIPTGATEAHGPHLPLDVDTHAAETVATELARRVGGLVAPPLPFGYSTMWMGFPGTISLSTRTFQAVVEDVCTSLVRHGFFRLLILNGHRPNGTACDVAARAVVDSCADRVPIRVTVVNYWEPAAVQLHALRHSAIGGMGHACELETSIELATRPGLVRFDRLDGVEPRLIEWDAVAPGEPSRTYSAWPRPGDGHPAIFGDPHCATVESGKGFLDAIVSRLVLLVESLDVSTDSYSERSLAGP